MLLPSSRLSLSLSFFSYDCATRSARVQTSGPPTNEQTSETDGSPTTSDLGRCEEVSEVGERGPPERWPSIRSTTSPLGAP